MLLMVCVVQETENTCGTTHWQAARTNCRSMATQAETGLCLATCRHAVILKGINMFQGEIFAYPLYVLKELTQKASIQFVCQDVICRFWPWLQKVRPALSNDPGVQATKDMKPFLSVMHAKAHDWACQVTMKVVSNCLYLAI